jgi:hypothetical protein
MSRAIARRPRFNAAGSRAKSWRPTVGLARCADRAVGATGSPARVDQIFVSIAIASTPWPYTRVGCFPLQVAAGGAESASGPLSAPGTGRRNRAKSASAASTSTHPTMKVRLREICELREHGESKRRAVFAREALLVTQTRRSCEYLREAGRHEADPAPWRRIEIDPPAKTARRIGYGLPIDVVDREFVEVAAMTITAAAIEAYFEISGIVESQDRRGHQEREAAFA